MNISEAKKAIKELYKTDNVVALISERGVGKTSAFKQCSKELEIGYIDIYAAALEGPDFMGLPQKDKIKNITTYFPPSFLPTKEAIAAGLYPPSGILVIEEINRVSPDTTSVLYPLLLDRQINGHILAEGWKLGITMNPDNSNYIVNSLDDAMVDRFISIYVEPNVHDYITFSRQNIFNENVLDFLKLYPEMLLIVKKDSSYINKAPTPRGWTKVQEVLNSCTFTNDLLLEVISGIIGSIPAATFMGYLNNNTKFPNTTVLLDDYKSLRSAIKALISENRIDLLKQIISSVIEKITPEGELIYQLNLFLNDLSQELQIVFYKEISSKRSDLFSEILYDLDSFDAVSDKIIDLMVG